MKNIYVIKTDNPTILYKNLLTDKLFILENSFMDVSECNREYKNIYITNSEDLILGGYHFNSKYGDEPQKTVQRDIDSRKYWEEDAYYISKIILTKDQCLIKDGVQAIDDEFLEWFCKNSSCEFVEVAPIITNNWNSKNTILGYRIIIPQEEPKKYPIGGYAPGYYSCKCTTCKKGFTGDKRAVQCEHCAIEMTKGEPKQERERDITITHISKPKQEESYRSPIVDNIFIGSGILDECKKGRKQETLEEFTKEVLEDEFFTNISEHRQAERFIEIGAKWKAEKIVDLLERLTPIYREDSDLYQNWELKRLEIIEQYKR